MLGSGIGILAYADTLSIAANIAIVTRDCVLMAGFLLVVLSICFTSHIFMIVHSILTRHVIVNLFFILVNIAIDIRFCGIYNMYVLDRMS